MGLSEEVTQFYDGFAEKYDSTVLQEKDYTAFERIPSWLLEVLQGQISLLDLGCGTGLGSKRFIELGHKVTGIDISPQMIQRARALGFNQLICQSLENPLPFSSAYFQAALLLGVMEFIEHPHTLFKEVARVLKPQGYFGLTIPKKLVLEDEVKMGILTHDPSTIEHLFHKCGFSILRKEDFQGFKYLGQTVDYCGYLVTKS